MIKISQKFYINCIYIIRTVQMFSIRVTLNFTILHVIYRLFLLIEFLFLVNLQF